MQKTMLKRILGLFILVFVFTFMSFPVVNAEDNCSKIDWAQRYNLSLDYDGTDFIFKMDLNNDSIADEIKTYLKNEKNHPIEFHVISVSNYVLSNDDDTPDDDIVYVNSKSIDYLLKNFQELKINAKSLGLNNDYIGVEFLLVPYVFVDPSKCQNIQIRLRIELPVSEPQYNAIDVGDSTETISGITQNIQCVERDANYKYDLTFEDQFCQAKQNSKNNTFNFGNGLYSDKENESFKCDFDINKKVVDIKEDLADSYYVNRSYRYGYGEKTVKTVTYNYNYENGKASETEDASCKLNCEEAVTVEYGPPVASKAGLCFEYKVKITSRVSCSETSGEIKKPKTLNYCTPVPICKSSKGNSNPQGGPNSEFDSCVISCDGGKYTDKCSEKCYNEVYSKSSITKTSGTELSYVLKIADASKGAGESLNSCNRLDTYHYCYNGKHIIWNVGGNTVRYSDKQKNNNGCSPENHSSINKYDCTTDSPWHRNHTWGWKGNYILYTDTGIPKTDKCSDNCYWIGCEASKKGGLYLNYDTAKHDAEANYKAYKELVDTCKAAASCNTTTAEFTISVDYTKKGSTEVTNISFPYSTSGDKKDKLTSLGSGSSKVNTACKDSNGTSSNCNSTILSYNGCYKDDNQKEAATKWYQAEWSFPGTWINAKTNQISYKPITDSAWKRYDKKFCIPLNAENVNQSWWNYYYTGKYSGDSKYALNDKKLMSKSVNIGNCSETITSCTYSRTSFTSEDAKKIKYNIHAFAKDFGYFNWNIKVDCFYALNDQSTGKNSEPICEETKVNNCSSSDNYVIRSVDLKNLFPGDNGDKVSPDKTGRTPGFNWTSYATQDKKDPEYKSNPTEYAKWVQTKAYTIYSKDYLDYEVKLTKDVIKKLKDNSRNYTEYKGSVDTASNSASHYRSPLFSSGGTLNGSVYPNGDALKCNNIGEHTLTSGYSAECQTY